ncbi:putative Transposase-associated domain-containing protein [Helianthus annuus]|nr:putative Transposase-associated domain-containing protein [Helianthus annuus]
MEWYNNRAWMYKMTNSDGFINTEYCENLKKWLDFVYSKDSVVDRRVTKRRKIVYDIRCPCLRCQNSIYLDRETVQKHLLKKGFMLDYYTWYEHGETSTREVGQSSTMREVDDDDDGCRRMVLDSMCSLADNSTINSNLDSSTLERDVPNLEAMGFYNMLQAADEPLWEGEKATDYSKLQAVTSFLNWKSLYNVSTACYDHIISMVKELMPEGNKLPENFYYTKKSLEKLFLPKERIDVCKNHCMLFYKQDMTLTQCKWCGESRYKSGQNKVPHLVMTYMPIGPRLKMLYMSTKTAKNMTWHHDHKTKEGSMAHPSDGKAWKHFDSVNPGFANEIRNVRLGLCTDGFNPNNSNSNPCSLWPVFLTIYNLPPWMSLKDAYIKLCLVIPGRKSPVQNVDVFLRPLIDELKELYEEGIEVYDAYRKENFMMRAILLWTVSDFPAYAMLSGWSTHGHLACPYCMGDTKAFRLQAGGKASWFDCHRRFLPRSHPFRSDRNGFRANKSIPSSLGPPPELTGWQIYEQVCDLPSDLEKLITG